MGMIIGSTIKYFRLVNRTASIPINKVRNMSMTPIRKRIPIEISMCAIGLDILTISMQRQYAMQRIMFIMKEINIFIFLFKLFRYK